MSVGFWQILLILLLAVLLFGAGRLPKIMADLASGLKAFRKNMEDDTTSSDPESNKSLPKKQKTEKN